MLTEETRIAINLINRAKADVDNVHLIYLDRHGEVDMVREPLDFEGSWEYEDLLRSSGSPCFEICFVKRGQVIDSAGDLIEDGDNVALQVCCDNAIHERLRFYTEREEEYGPSAWPMACR